MAQREEQTIKSSPTKSTVENDSAFFVGGKEKHEEKEKHRIPLDRKPDGDRNRLHDSGNRNLFWDGDTRLTYPRYGKERAVELFEKLKSLSDFVIMDCMSNPNESLLSLAALETASQTVRLCTPELPSISWYRTQKAVWGSAFPWADMNQGLNLTDNGNLPVEEAREQLGEVSFLLPFSREIRSAMSMATDFARIKKDYKFSKSS